MTGNVLAVVIGYVLGSIPPGLVLVRLARGVDVREHGSGKIGATNVMRVLGFRAAVAVAVFDQGKGVAAVYIARAQGDARYVDVLAALAALAGHNWSVFLRFSGGRGVNTGMGALFAMSPIWAAASLGSGIVAVAIARYVSLGSLVGAAFSFFALLVLALTGREPWEYFAYTAAGVPVIFYQHRDNIQRLLSGTERRLGDRRNQQIAGEPRPDESGYPGRSGAPS
jgi:glycerol-3-phosphate acyltransferase PlsY